MDHQALDDHPDQVPVDRRRILWRRLTGTAGARPGRLWRSWCRLKKLIHLQAPPFCIDGQVDICDRCLREFLAAARNAAPTGISAEEERARRREMAQLFGSEILWENHLPPVPAAAMAKVISPPGGPCAGS